MADYPRRLNFVHGQNLTDEDWQTEQNYHRSMRHLQNRLHGHGVVSGLEIVAGHQGLTITAGVAIDAHGRELILAEDRLVPLDLRVLTHEADVLLVWAQIPARTIPGHEEQELVSMWMERPEAMVVPPDQGPPDAVRLGRVTPGIEGDPEIDDVVRCRHPLAGQELRNL